eukprot:TRINITY_DN3920_c0_g2_i1.p1 TRINITY_DN3920_c0_g2~~TRINITY_DN3920_c0_g2_i1.p1  ORF type:complete len:438 (-),score=183.38 TRINITY_DN3920_c0_g2_i1:370-1683(-)
MEYPASDWRKLQRVIDGLRTQKELAELALRKEGALADVVKKNQQRLEEIDKQLGEYTAELEQLRDSIKKHKQPLYYGDYLALDNLLASQLPQSDFVGKHAHDELLFIVTHQAYELWFKQILAELDSVQRRMAPSFVTGGSIGRIVHHLERVIQILRLLVQQIDVLETMTPLDFMDFRDFLFPASGFQSVQFRLIENRLGLDAKRRAVHDQRPYHAKLSCAHAQVVQQAETGGSLFTALEQWLERTPFLQSKSDNYDFWEWYRTAVKRMFDSDAEVITAGADEPSAQQKAQLEKLDETRASFLQMFDEPAFAEQIDKGLRRLSFKATKAALLIFIFQDEPIMQQPYRLLQCLIDIDEQMTAWRYKHAMMVQRMLGTKIGTGGSSGYWYLRDTVSRSRVFQDIANLASFLIPRSALPELPKPIQAAMGFTAEAEDKRDN